MTIKLKSTVLTLVAWIAAAGMSSANDATGKLWQFEVALDGKPIGSHTFQVEDDGSKQILTTTAEFDVKFLFVTAFRYRHENTEVWNSGCLSSIDAETNNNGKLLGVQGALNNGQFDLQSAQGPSSLPACVQTFAYWNPGILDAEKLLNSQTGAYEDVRATFEGFDRVDVAGKSVDSVRYRLSAQAGDITLWYSMDESTWLRLEAPAKGGRTLTYTAVTVPEGNASSSLIAKAN